MWEGTRHLARARSTTKYQMTNRRRHRFNELPKILWGNSKRTVLTTMVPTWLYFVEANSHRPLRPTIRYRTGANDTDHVAVGGIRESARRRRRRDGAPRKCATRRSDKESPGAAVTDAYRSRAPAANDFSFGSARRSGGHGCPMVCTVAVVTVS